MKLVADWRQAHREASVWAGWAGVLFTSIGIAASYAASAMSFLPVLSYRAVLWIALAIFVCVLAGRLLQQGRAKPDDTDQAGA